MLNLYSAEFQSSVVLWRATSKKNKCINYRFYPRKPFDTLTPAMRAGLIHHGNPLAQLIVSWTNLYNGAGEQLCDFDSDAGLSKTWVFLQGIRPIDDILNAECVPESIQRHRSDFHALGLNYVRHVAVDWKEDTVNLYFRIKQPINSISISTLTALAGSDGPNALEMAEMKRYLPADGFTFAVTMALVDGSVHRVAFYAMRLPPGEYPESIGESLREFLKRAPSYDKQEMNAVAWSFGKDGGTYVKAERSYCGDLVDMLKNWGTTMRTS